ncbi:DUF805 domain-containing protein [Undibacterium terreum]|uniref:DUF805 domain-containing protein n=1 Tax=Undibacterium terreum TaxID=1224302 RepID=A0A916U8E6_9BURK|nr:DUF805 domain-containing protein [Undibacterium terreum]GGC63645.1 DUF805 domain-containing protein [Undibacterium terreum]
MNFDQSINTCFTKYADFNGRASKSEYWWWMLFVFLASAAASIVDERLANLFAIAVLLPSLAVATRRLHDTNRSGWWQLIELIPLIGFIIMVVWCVQDPVEPNRFTASAPAEV